MGGNYAPGTGPGDPEAPWNEPVPGEPTDSQAEQSHLECAVCSPPTDLHQRVELGLHLPFCDSHDREDFEEKLEHEQQHRREQTQMIDESRQTKLENKNDE